MNGKTLVLATLSASLLLSASAGTSFAKPRPHAERGMMSERGMMREVIFVRMLKQFDANKDGQITKDELKAGVDKLFTAIDADKDNSITPKEFRAYAEQKMKERQEAREKAGEKGAGDTMKDMGKQGTGEQGMGEQGMGEHHMGRHHMGKQGMRHGGRMGAMLFRHADTDENGQISRQEAEAAADKLFARMDRNNDGVISIDDMPDW